MHSDSPVLDPTAIRQRRRHAGLKQSALARKVGISPAHMCNIESGKVQDPGVDIIAAIARELGCTVPELEQANPSSRTCLPLDGWYYNFDGVKAAKAARALRVSRGTVLSWARRGLVRFTDTGSPNHPSYVYCWADIQELARIIDGHPRPSLRLLKRRMPANPGPLMLAHAYGRARVEYAEAMHQSGLPDDTISKIHAQVNQALALYVTAGHPQAGRPPSSDRERLPVGAKQDGPGAP